MKNPTPDCPLCKDSGTVMISDAYARHLPPVPKPCICLPVVEFPEVLSDAIIGKLRCEFVQILQTERWILRTERTHEMICRGPRAKLAALAAAHGLTLRRNLRAC